VIWLEYCRLDKYYVITRYPNGLPGATPSEYFDEGEALEAISAAKNIIELVKAKITEIQG
jgi:HEPN domain-containing protein